MGSEIEKRDDVRSFEQPDSELPPLPVDDDDLLSVPSELAASQPEDEGSALLERDMRRKLMDIESSFLPDGSPGPAVAGVAAAGADDTYLFGGSPGNIAVRPGSQLPAFTESSVAQDLSGEQDSSLLASPETPSGVYETPAPTGNWGVAEAQADPNNSISGDNTSSLELTLSSPAAAAAQRTLARAASVGNAGRLISGEDQAAVSDPALRSSHLPRPSSRASTVKGPPSPPPEGITGPSSNDDSLRASQESGASEKSGPALPLLKRPSFWKNRQASQRSSTSSVTNRSDLSGDAASDVTLGADYALQSGGAAPAGGAMARTAPSLSRLPSLSSVASSTSAYSESFAYADRNRTVSGQSEMTGSNRDSSLETLAEEDKVVVRSPPATPRPTSSSTINGPTDTVIAQHVQNIRVPDTIAKEYRERFSQSPHKRQSSALSSTNNNRNTLTLKEQNSKIDKLSKENFDLKLKIHFLDQALQNRSDEGVKEMISKNVQLQTDLANERKETQSLRRKLRDLERKLKAQEDGQATPRPTSSGSDEAKSHQSSRQAEMEAEIMFLREALERSEVQLEHFRQETIAREVDKRTLGEYIKSVEDRSASEPDTAAVEATEMWKDLLQAETARREQADEDAQRLREEIRRLKGEEPAGSARGYVRNNYHINQRKNFSYAQSQSGTSDSVNGHNGGLSSSSTLIDQLRHENAELRRDLGAQTSMLTSRNRERERLQQEIEDLKLQQRRGEGGLSVTGDSIFERSVSRAHQRPTSRASAATTQVTHMSPMSDHEREEYEKKQEALRDELAEVKLLSQELDRELNVHIDALTQMEAEVRALKEEKELACEDLQALQAERDEVLLSLQDKEAECEGLRDEALATIDKMEDEIEQKERDLTRVVTELDTRNEDFAALQREMKSVSESLIQLEDDRQASRRKIQAQEREIEDANRELEALDKRIQESTGKIQRLEVQLESNQNEIDFLREEQEADKIKIGELEATLSATQASLQEEKERFKELEESLAQERRQREILDSQEKEEVQKVLNDLNSQASKAREEVRRLRKNLSQKEVEATTWKARLDELESSLREALGDLNGTRSSLLKDVSKLQKDLDSTIQELENTKGDLAEKDRLLRNRDALLESTGLESRKLSDLLEKERQARKQDRQHFEQAQRGQHNVTRTIQQHETRVLELETARSQDRRKLATLEQQYREQLAERNNLLLAIWNRLSTLCGADWCQKNSLIGGEVPSLEAIGRNLPEFKVNIISAVRTVEGLVGSFRSRIRNIEKDLWRDYQTLEHNLDVRIRRMDQLESIVQRGGNVIRSPSRSSSRSLDQELARLKGENKMLKAELHFHRTAAPPSRPTHSSSGQEGHAQRPPQSPLPGSSQNTSRAAAAATLLRHHSTSAVEALRQVTGVKAPDPQQLEQLQELQRQAQARMQSQAGQPLQPSEQRWIHRLKELERRLKAEREARLLDRSGARKRLEEGRAENEELRMLLEREKEKRLSLVSDEE